MGFLNNIMRQSGYRMTSYRVPHARKFNTRDPPFVASKSVGFSKEERKQGRIFYNETEEDVQSFYRQTV